MAALNKKQSRENSRRTVKSDLQMQYNINLGQEDENLTNRILELSNDKLDLLNRNSNPEKYQNEYLQGKLIPQSVGHRRLVSDCINQSEQVTPQNINVHHHFNQPSVVNFNAYTNGGQEYLRVQQQPSSAQGSSYRSSTDKLHQIHRYSPSRRPASAFPMRSYSGKRMRKQSHTPMVLNDWNNLQPEIIKSQPKKQLVKPSQLAEMLQSNFRKKLIPANIQYKREDLYDQNLALKLNINDTKDDNIRLRTRLTQISMQLKGRDKLIEELYKSAYITANGNEARQNLNKDALLIINLQREVQQLKDHLISKDDDIANLKMSIKLTKVQELEAELRMYIKECKRLRKISQHAIKVSGEIDIKRMQVNYQNQQKIFTEQLSTMSKELDIQQRLSHKLQSQLLENQLHLKNQQAQFDLQATEIQQIQLKNDSLESEKHRLTTQIDSNKKVICDLEKECDKLRADALSKASQHRKDIAEKNEKIQELIDELLQKDTLIDNQAVLNKNLQKKLDNLNESYTKFNDQYSDAQQKLAKQEQENNSIRNQLSLQEISLGDKLKLLQDAIQSKDLQIKQLRDDLETLTQTNKLEVEIAQLTMQQKIDDLLIEIAACKQSEGKIRKELDAIKNTKQDASKQAIYQTTQKKGMKQHGTEIASEKVEGLEEKPVLGMKIISQSEKQTDNQELGCEKKNPTQGDFYYDEEEVEEEYECQSKAKSNEIQRPQTAFGIIDQSKTIEPSQSSTLQNPQTIIQPIQQQPVEATMQAKLGPNPVKEPTKKEELKKAETPSSPAQDAQDVVNILRKLMKDQDHGMSQITQEQAIKNTFSCMGRIVDIIIEGDYNSIRECLIDKIYTVSEEDFGDEAEFVNSAELLSVFNIQDKSGLVLQVLGEYLNFDTLVQIIEKLGSEEDMPESKKHLNYRALNLQSKRIFNRINKYFQDHKKTDLDVFKSVITIQTVKTKTKIEKVDILKDIDFFKKLHELGIVKSLQPKKNMCKFLCIDENYQSSLMFKKLQKALKDFGLSQALTLVGCKKLNVPKQETLVSNKEPEIPQIYMPPNTVEDQLPKLNQLSPPSEPPSEYEYQTEEVSYYDDEQQQQPTAKDHKSQPRIQAKQLESEEINSSPAVSKQLDPYNKFLKYK